MKPLPKSPEIDLAESIYDEINRICREYDPSADITIKGWEPNIENLIKEKLKRLKICVLVGTPETAAEEKIAGGSHRWRIPVSIESTPMLQPGEGADSWDADDLSFLLRSRLDGQTFEDSESLWFELRVTSSKPKKTNSLNKATEFILETSIESIYE